MDQKNQVFGIVTITSPIAFLSAIIWLGCLLYAVFLLIKHRFKPSNIIDLPKDKTYKEDINKEENIPLSICYVLSTSIIVGFIIIYDIFIGK